MTCPSGIWARNTESTFNYSDGDEIEERLLNQVSAAQDVSLASDELQRLMIDWPSEYHFSPLRANLLSSFHLNHYSRILEVGSGCGAITRLLGEQCPESTILALEGSSRRAEITRVRCRDLVNVEVCHDSFTKFQSLGTFDLITLVGVLEYSPSFENGDDPLLSTLIRAKNLLGPNGLLIIAIENQLGLKYFNGCAEDHTGTAFTGVNDLYKSHTVRTLGRKELQEHLIKAGFKEFEIVYPFPDYKLPQLLVRNSSFKVQGLDLANLIGQYPAKDYVNDTPRLFYETRVWNLLVRNDICTELANSFLVFAFNGEGKLSDITDPWLVKTFSSKRKKQYLTETAFSESNNKIVVKKNLCYPTGPGRQGAKENDEAKLGIIHHLESGDYVEGVPYRRSLHEKMDGKDSFDQFVDYLVPWIDWLKRRAKQKTDINSEILWVSGKLYDCMPANFLTDNTGQLYLIDQEWEILDSVELGFVAFRGLYREIYENIEFLEKTELFSERNVQKLLEDIFHVFHIKTSETNFNQYIDLEVKIQLQLVAYWADSDTLKEIMSDFLIQKRAGHQNEVTHAQRAGGGETIEDLSKLVKDRDMLLATIYQSNSWRITAPLRFMGYLIRGEFDECRNMLRKIN